MKPRFFFRTAGHAIPTKRFNWPAWLWPANAIAALIAVYGLTVYLDDLDEVERQRRAEELLTARMEGFEIGRQAGNEEMLASARAAWQAAIEEGEIHCAANAKRPQ